jgi:hypothetical protein
MILGIIDVSVEARLEPFQRGRRFSSSHQNCYQVSGADIPPLAKITFQLVR